MSTFFTPHHITSPVAVSWQRLAAAVIGKAFSDAIGDCQDSHSYGKTAEKMARHVDKVSTEAKAWIKKAQFYPWDAALGVDPRKITRALDEAIASKDTDWYRRQVKFMRMTWKGSKDERTVT